MPTSSNSHRGASQNWLLSCCCWTSPLCEGMRDIFHVYEKRLCPPLLNRRFGLWTASHPRRLQCQTGLDLCWTSLEQAIVLVSPDSTSQQTNSPAGILVYRSDTWQLERRVVSAGTRPAASAKALNIGVVCKTMKALAQSGDNEPFVHGSRVVVVRVLGPTCPTSRRGTAPQTASLASRLTSLSSTNHGAAS